jgi:hypothetical protein
MKREFLEGLGLEKEAIDKIMAENGADIEKQKQETTKVSETLTGVQAQLEDANKAIKGFEDLDVEGIKKAAQDWETKYNTDTENLKKQIDQKDYEHAAEAYLGNYKFTSDLAKKAVISEFNQKGFKFDDGKFLGADDFMKTVQESNPAAFEVFEGDGTARVDTGGNHGDDVIGDKFIESMMKGAGLIKE